MQSPGTPAERWIGLALGVACVGLGIVLVERPFTSLGAVVALVAAGLAVAGLSEIVSAARAPRPRLRFAAGLGWLAAAALTLIWKGITIHALAVVVGASLIAGGVTRCSDAVRGRSPDRVASALVGLSSLIFGLLALTWPDITLLVLGWLAGPAIALFGLGQIVSAARPWRGVAAGSGGRALPRWLRLAGAGVVLLLALAVGAASVAFHRASPSPDAFYTPPHVVPRSPGVLLRSERFTRGIPAGARAWRILYTTTRDAGQPAVASALVVAATRPPGGRRPIIAWAHGTTGVATPCAPSLLASRFSPDVIPGLNEIIKRGWVLVATDYIGLGTAGPHPYLIGQGEARSVLDAVRAARRIPSLQATPVTVVWGHSQGGHAALWAGMLAPTYAPGDNVVGVAAIAPASDLPALVAEVKDTLEGRVIGSYIVSAFSDIYPDVSFDRYVRPAARVLVRHMARRCLDIPEAIPSVLKAMFSREPIYAADPLTGALGERLRQNTPTGRITAPVLIAQGLNDPLVTPRVQNEFVRQRCAAHQDLEYRTYPGRDHLSILSPGSPFVRDLLAWTEARLEGRKPPAGCTTTSG